MSMASVATVPVGAATVKLVLSPEGRFMGVGGVQVAGVALRSQARPMVLRVDTPAGVLYTWLELLDVCTHADQTVRVELNAHGLRWGRCEYSDDYDQSLVTLFDTDEGLTDRVDLILAPAAQSLSGREWEGFSYSVRFCSKQRRIHRVLVHGTWEIGGTVLGNTVFSQGQCNMPVYQGSREQAFTTACLTTLDRYGDPLGYSFQLGPRGGLVQGFDFQCAPQGVLLQYWSRMNNIVSLLESPPGNELLHIVDEYRFPSAGDVTTPAKQVLFSAESLEPHQAKDLWWEVREAVYGQQRAVYGIVATPPRPEADLKYSTRVTSGRLRMSVGGQEVDSCEVPYAIAEQVLPVLAERGVRRFFPVVMNESDVTVLGLRRKLEGGLHGSLHCSSVCATHRFFPSDFWGGIKAWKYMADKAGELGMEIGAWFAPHLSARAPIFAEHPEYRMTSVTGLPAGGGYGFQTLCVADWNTPIFDWALADLKRWKQEGGLDYLFIDSLSNLGLLQVNYAADMRGNTDALGRLIAEIQALGIGSLSCECISPWAAGRFGVNDLRGDLLEQDRAVAGQNDFGWWADHLDMAAGLSLFVTPHRRTPQELEQYLFKSMAAGGYICYPHDYGSDHRLADWWARLNHIHSQALPNMKQRRIMPQDQGVIWTDGRVETVWTFKDCPCERRADLAVTRLTGEGTEALPHTGSLWLPAWGVYRLGP